MISFMAAYYFILLNRVDPTFNRISWLFSVLLLLATYLLAKEIGLNRGSIIAAFMLTTSSLFTLSLVR
jgi:asparagine N-glycosylation enzyme membrane subunit Stt3